MLVTIRAVDCFLGPERPVTLAWLRLDRDLEAELSAPERAAIAGFGPLRRRTWAGGRIALRAALSAAGAGEVGFIATGERGAPVLPPGFAGSIAHKDDVAVAIAARADAGTFLGVDVELDEPLGTDISRHVLTEDEARQLAPLATAERLRALRVTFALKEAIYKAIAPTVRRWVGYREVAVEVGLAPEHPSRTNATLHWQLEPPSPRALDVAVRWQPLAEAGAVFVAFARARAAPSV